MFFETFAEKQKKSKGEKYDALKARSRDLKDENRRLRSLIRTLIENDPDDMAADGVTVLEVWRKEAAQMLG
jgi:hypothetical protein